MKIFDFINNFVCFGSRASFLINLKENQCCKDYFSFIIENKGFENDFGHLIYQLKNNKADEMDIAFFNILNQLEIKTVYSSSLQTEDKGKETTEMRFAFIFDTTNKDLFEQVKLAAIAANYEIATQQDEQEL